MLSEDMRKTLAVSEKSSLKVRSALRGFELLGTGPGAILEPYRGRTFRDSDLSKEDAFRQILQGELADPTVVLLSERCNLPFHKDARSSIDYGIDLVLGWLLEDAVLLALNNKGLIATLQGHDRHREFLRQNEISQDPDILLRSETAERTVEVMCDWKSTWRKKNHLDLRTNKHNRLTETSSLLLGLAPESEDGLIIDLSESKALFEAGPISGYGGKPGYTLKGVRTLLIPFSDTLDAVVQIMNINEGGHERR
jgi:hypothetical protein